MELKMIETPKCPYCGAEMLRTDNITTACMSSRYRCRECGSAAPQVNELDWAKFLDVPEIAREAALRRAEPENRALTLEELKAHCAKGRDAEPLWVEYGTVRDMALWVLANTPCGMDEKDIPSLAYWLKDEELVSEYGKFWRCWLRKPTPEQKAAVEWEE